MKKSFLLVLVCLLTAIAVVGCSSPSPATSESTASDSTVAEAPQEAYAPDMAPEGEYAEAEAAGGVGDLPNITVPDTSRKLVYSATFTIDSKQFDADYAAIKNALGAVGGYIENEYTYSSGTDYGAARTSTLTLRVPVAKYNDFLDTLSGIGKVSEKQIMTEDISDQYYDTESRIEILEMQRDRLLGYLETATDMDDIISLEDELSDVLYELDQYQGSRRKMDDMVDFSAVAVSLNEVLTPQAVTDGGSAPEPASQRAAGAFQLSMANVGVFLQNVGIFFAAAAPILLLIAAIVVAVVFIRKLVLYLKGKHRKGGQQ